MYSRSHPLARLAICSYGNIVRPDTENNLQIGSGAGEGRQSLVGPHITENFEKSMMQQTKGRKESLNGLQKTSMRGSRK